MPTSYKGVDLDSNSSVRTSVAAGSLPDQFAGSSKTGFFIFAYSLSSTSHSCPFSCYLP